MPDTVPLLSYGLPVQTLSITVTAGPLAGRSVVSERDVLTIGSASGNDLVLEDPTVSRFHLELRSSGGRIEIVDLGSTNGTRVGPVLLRQSRAEIAAGTTITLGGTQLRVEDGAWIVDDDAPPIAGLYGRSEPLRRLAATIASLAPTNVSVYVRGESGTGKELVARAIHDSGPRREQPFVTVDCGAISPTLFASELFGHERGAFTGADRRHVGAFERANGGTVFLDEVAELSPELQASLLGALERRRIRRVGGTQDIPIDLRVVCATHRDLRAEVNANRFRLDLFYRLAIVRVLVPPLRERASDVPTLIAHFLEEAGYEGPIDALFPPASIDELKRRPWPGNVRELRNTVLATLALGRPPPDDDDDAPPSAPGATAIPDALLRRPYKEARREVVDAFERRYLEALLERTESVRAAAREASMDRSYLIELLRRHGLG
ncbi:Response regulator of zinc sigma-54-dependent two-component system [Sandaracinus amylolyticus]|uniref:Response regulator of zinc sigma-54-dependent two-component system n=1 Tax=Sandaracinus amylolyticus TaxID=927083 RepID=A0A0F6VZP4_9BACT|nr:Response regulator of zinc sigma-54-dependent two-component system [Sandaracinus amylolyticus]